MHSILVFFHTPSNVGYAIAPLEQTFFRMALELTGGDWRRIHFAYSDLRRGSPATLPAEFSNVIQFDPASTDVVECERIERYVTTNGIDVAFGFDQPVTRASYRHLRRGGVRRFISYWGAPMSSLTSVPRLWLKRLQVALSKDGPDHYIFESHGMARTAYEGRGILKRRTSVVHLGVDIDRFKPSMDEAEYVYRAIGLPRDRKVFFYAGHMEVRKGVDVLITAARYMVERHARHDFHLLILGNKAGEEARFVEALQRSEARRYVTFGGYRSDVEALLRGCYLGAIASTGWDSFPRTGVEIASSGLPLVVSDLPGLNETVVDGVTGYTFPVGDAEALASRWLFLLDHPEKRNAMSAEARLRVEKEFSLQAQHRNLLRVMREVVRD